MSPSFQWCHLLTCQPHYTRVTDPSSVWPPPGLRWLSAQSQRALRAFSGFCPPNPQLSFPPQPWSGPSAEDQTRELCLGTFGRECHIRLARFLRDSWEPLERSPGQGPRGGRLLCLSTGCPGAGSGWQVLVKAPRGPFFISGGAMTPRGLLCSLHSCLLPSPLWGSPAPRGSWGCAGNRGTVPYGVCVFVEHCPPAAFSAASSPAVPSGSPAHRVWGM